MKLSMRQLKRMIKEEIVRVKEVFGRPEVASAWLSQMDCEKLKAVKISMEPGGAFGDEGVREDAPIWARIEVAMVEKCSDQAAEPLEEEDNTPAEANKK
jgi:hypothetical protein